MSARLLTRATWASWRHQILVTALIAGTAVGAVVVVSLVLSWSRAQTALWLFCGGALLEAFAAVLLLVRRGLLGPPFPGGQEAGIVREQVLLAEIHMRTRAGATSDEARLIEAANSRASISLALTLFSAGALVIAASIALGA